MKLVQRALSKYALYHKNILGGHTQDIFMRFICTTFRAFTLLIRCLLVLLVGFYANANEMTFAKDGETKSTQASLSYHYNGEIKTLTDQATIKILYTQVDSPTPSVIEFLQFEQGDNGQAYQLESLLFSQTAELNAGFVPGQSEVAFGNEILGQQQVLFPTTVTLVPTKAYTIGEPIFVKVRDVDQNKNDQISEHIVISLSASGSTDKEVIVLVETSPSSGEFIGYIPSIRFVEQIATDGVLALASNSEISATYVDRFDQSDVSATAALVDPFGLIFNSDNGEGVDGVEITLVNADSNEPAEVFANDGITPYPSTLISGSLVKDEAGNEYQLGQGEYHFPLIRPGNYRLQITPPEGYFDSFSRQTNEQLRQLSNGTDLVLVNGSRGEVFEIVPGPAIQIDVPIDPIPSEPFIVKRANKSSAALGDFIQYTISVENPSLLRSTEPDFIIDTLPVGFRYVKDSLTIDEQVSSAIDVSADGQILKIALPSIDVESIINVKYVAQIGPGTPLGEAVNVAELASLGGSGNVAKAQVTIVEDLFQSKSILMGRVIWDNCQGDVATTNSKGVENARIFIEDGTFVNTDSNGLWHIEGVKPGSHIVQLDLESLPENLEVVQCKHTSQRAGTPFSEFVDVQGGTMWRVDFHLREKPSEVGQVQLNHKILTRSERLVNLKVHFEHDKAIVLPQYFAEISQLAEYLKANPDAQVTIAGHTSSVGAEKYNFKLSFERADAIKTVLIKRFNIAPERITSKGYGESKLLKLGDSEDDHQVNRRIEAIINHLSAPSVPQTLKVALDVQLAMAPSYQQALKDIALHYQLPAGWQLKPNSLYIDKVQADFDDIALGLRIPLTAKELQEVRFELMPSTQLSTKVSYNGTAMAQVVYHNPLPYDEVMSNKTPQNAIPLLDLLNSQPRFNVAQSDSPNINRKVTERSVESKEQGVAMGLGSVELEADQTRDTSVAEQLGILSLKDGQFIARSTTAIRFRLDSRLKPKLFVDAKEVSADRQAYKSANRETGKTTYNYIGVEVGEQGEHEVLLQGIGPFGNARYEQKITVTRTGEVQKLRLVQAQGNIADGKTPLKIQLALLDNQGNHIPSEVKLSIENSSLKPFQNEHERNNLEADGSQLTMAPDGTVLFNPVAKAGLYSADIIYDDEVAEHIKFYVSPYLRDWILVGFAQGTLGYNHLSGHMESLTANDFDDDLYQDGEIKFYAKGRVSGDWLLTLAYDSSKKVQEEILNQTITPGAYYTLYGDASMQRHDAASREKLYLRIERDKYFALFGDYSTGLNHGELVNYSRSMTGFKSEYNGELFNVNMFAANTELAFVRDDIQGQGISGLYYLTNRDLVANSETITLQVRDRFRPEIIVEETQLARFIDYSIDYVDGSLFFKRPIMSVDRNNNPQYIVAEYETKGELGKKDLVAGGRLGFVLPSFTDAEDGEIGITHISEGDSGRDGTLTGVDIEYNFTEDVRLKAEVARSDTNFEGENNQGDAYVVELNHKGEIIDAMAYVREQEGGFGLGQQSQSEESMRKVGTDLRYHLGDDLELDMTLYQQKDLTTTRKRDVAEAKVDYKSDRDNYFVGVRTAKDSGGAESKVDEKSDQFIVGARKQFLDGDLTLSTDLEKTLANDDNQAYPTRISLGADYDITSSITFNADQEFSRSDDGNEQTTLLGLTANPWEGMSLATNMSQALTENSERVLANYGLFQNVELNSNWQISFGFDRAELLSDSDKEKPENGTDEGDFNQSEVNSEDFSALSMGANYNTEAWMWDSLIEYRMSDSDDKWNVMSSALHDLSDGIVVAAKLDINKTTSNIELNKTLKSGISFGYAYRPITSRWIVLNKLEFKYNDVISQLNDNKSRRYINNTNANYVLDDDTQLSLQYSFKYVLESFESGDYSGFTDLMGAEVRHNVNAFFDVGLHANILNSRQANMLKLNYGVSIGYSPEKNMWLSLGYNFSGFDDKDFSQSEYTAEGVFLKFRIKADQESFKSIFEE
ncbi:OmpA family protein [Thalassotalea aquiviva]|uniref:OmpA family protein n=1 Tax=Thalassotalea aquiviva TaxID=3242415 RepID=UPI00352A2774